MKLPSTSGADPSTSGFTPLEKGSLTGFTIIEVILVVALISFLAGLGLFAGMDVYRSYSYRSERSMFISALQKARLTSMINLNEAKHGVRIEQDKYVIFQGDSYGASPSLDQVVIPASTIKFRGTTFPVDIIFDQLSGETAGDVSIAITDGVRNTIISVNNEGQISW